MHPRAKTRRPSVNLATLRVCGETDELEALQKCLGLVVDGSWTKGEPRRRGGCHADSGFNAIIADTDSPASLERIIQEFSKRCSEQKALVSSLKLQIELAIGVGVGSDKQFIGAIELSSEVLLPLAQLGITVSFAGYPISDE